MKPLEPWQLELRGTTLVEASAGTGKTHTLTTLYLRLLVEADLLPARILVVTYTEAATAELRTRVRERIQQAIRAQDPEASAGEAIEEEVRALALRARREAEERGGPDALRRALQAFDEASIFTIHGFCQRTLQEHAFESGMAFDAELVERSEPVDRTLAHDLLGERDVGVVERTRRTSHRVGDERRDLDEPFLHLAQLLLEYLAHVLPPNSGIRAG